MERIDHYKPHFAADTQSLLTSLEADYVYIPAGCTGIAQPMDVSINAPFKRKIVDIWVEWCHLPAARTPAHNFKQPTRQQVIEWVSQSWYEIPNETIIKSLKKCGILNALDGSEDSEI